MTEQEKRNLLERAIKATRNWGIGFGLLVVAALPVGAAADERSIERQHEEALEGLCTAYAQTAELMLGLRRQGYSASDALALARDADANTRREVRRIVVDIWSLPSANIPTQAVMDAEFVDCLWRHRF